MKRSITILSIIFLVGMSLCAQSRAEEASTLKGLAGMIIGRALYDGRVDLAAAVRLAAGS